MNKNAPSLEDRIASIEKFVFFAVILIATFLQVKYGNLEKFLGYIPEGIAQVFIIYLVILVIIVTLSFSIFYLTLIGVYGAAAISDSSKRLFEIIYEKTKHLWAFWWIPTILIGMIVTHYILKFEWNEIIGTLILGTIVGVVWKIALKI